MKVQVARDIDHLSFFLIAYLSSNILPFCSAENLARIGGTVGG